MQNLKSSPVSRVREIRMHGLKGGLTLSLTNDSQNNDFQSVKG
jgi:hypothetical protein